MKLVVVTYGTEGDARPFAALCRGLIDAGHEARLLANAGTLGSAEALGVPTTALAGNIWSTLCEDAMVGNVVNGRGFNDTAHLLSKIANENAETWLRTVVEAFEGCDAILVGGLAAFVGFSAAEYLGVKSIGSGMIPITPTAAFPSPFLRPELVPRLLNRVSHRFVNAMLWKAFRAKTNEARAKFRLPRRRSVWTGVPMLYGVSPHPVATARRLAGQRSPLRTVVGLEPRVGTATGAYRLPLVGRRSDLHRLRQHDRIRQRAAPGGAD
jgi:sterol 3beta-glucosyltransferase